MPDQTVAKNIRATRLDTFCMLIISGPDRADFLQGQLTQDILKLETAGTALAGWASAKGRLLAVGQLIATDDEIWWPLPADIIDGIEKRMKMFVLRARVKIVQSTMPVSGILGIHELDRLQIAGATVPLEDQPSRLVDGSIVVRVIGDPDRAWLIGPAAEAGEFEIAPESRWVLQSIRTGLPYIVADTQEQFVPQMLNLDRIGAISFDKGCYVGQEIVARTQNLGRIKRRMYRFTTSNTTQLPPSVVIYGPDNATGKVVLSSENEKPGELLAVVPIDAATGPWFADELKSVKLTNQPLPYPIIG